MKAILFILIFLFSASLFSAEPMVKFYNVDGSAKEYKLNDIDSLSVIDQKNNYVLRIHYDDTLVAYYPTEIIGSIKFEKDSLNVYIFGFPKPYKISSIDSLVFYIDQWQPLTIGSQVWMLKNLNVDNYRNGDYLYRINIDDFQSFSGGAYCYYNNSDSLGIIYGKLYNWYAVNESRNLAPTGWHIPSDEEWTVLSNYLGGISVAGGKLKEIDFSHWHSPNTGATNESGFSAIPGGYIISYYPDFHDIGVDGMWWSSSEVKYTSEAWFRNLDFLMVSFNRNYINKRYGLSVRCIKDK